MQEMITVHLVLTYHWYDEMLAGRKHTEYRKKGGMWDHLIWNRRATLTHAIFSRGYTSKTIWRPIQKIDIGPCPYDGWPGNYYRLHLGPIMHNVEDNGISNTVDPLVRKEPGRILHDVITGCDDFWPKFSDEDKAIWIEEETEILERLGIAVS